MRDRSTVPLIRLAPSVGLLLCLALLLPSCSEERITLGEPGTVGPQMRIEAGETTAKRFGLRSAAPDEPTEPVVEIPFGGFRSEVPEGWTLLEPSQFRDHQVQAPNGVQAWVTRLKGNGGGPESNLIRWAVSQLGMDRAPAIESLPRRPWLYGEAYVVRLAHDGERLEGRMLFSEQGSVFVRIRGTDEELDPILPDFESWVDSIEIRHGGLGVTWSAPPGFELAPIRPRTLAVYRVGQADAWVLVEGSDLGGLEANLKRWAEQAGSTLEGEATVTETIDLGGVGATLLRARGERLGLDAIYCFDGEKCVTVKMTGPVAAVEAARSSFDAWIASFEL